MHFYHQVMIVLLKTTFNTFALSVLSEYMFPFTLRGGIDEEWLGLIRAFSVFHQF